LSRYGAPTSATGKRQVQYEALGYLHNICLGLDTGIPKGDQMRIAVISDIHGNFLALENVAKDIKMQGIDQIAFLGDLVMTGPRPREAYELLVALNPAIWIQGNTDNWLVEIDDKFVPKNDSERFIMDLNKFALSLIDSKIKEELVSKPIKTIKEYNDIGIVFCHGSPRSSSEPIKMDLDPHVMDAMFETGERMIVCGHTHIRQIIQYKDKNVVNFGAISVPANDSAKTARYGIIDINKNGIVSYICRDIEYDIDAFFRDLKDRKYPGIKHLEEKYGINSRLT
jgi:putative phosphoesterase